MKLNSLIFERNLDQAKKLQYVINKIIYKLVSGHANLYAIAKEVLRINENLNLGSVREPLEPLSEQDKEIAKETAKLILEAKNKFL